LSSYKDFRAPGDPPVFPFTGMIEHTLSFQTSLPGLDIYVHYNLPSGTIMTITDQIGGSFLNIGPFIGQGIATIPGTYIDIFSSAYLKMFYHNIGGVPTTDPVFSMIPDSLNFGVVDFGYTKTLPVTITNVGYPDSLYITNVVSFNPAFTIYPNSFPLIIAPTESQIFNITYTATPGEHIDSIIFFHNALGSPTKLNVYATTTEPYPNCQAQILNKVIITDGAIEQWLRFGLDSTATDGIDPQLGEIGPLPPFPPTGVFHARFFLPENNFSGSLNAYCDFRYADLPFIGQKEWRLAYQPSYGNDIIIIWDFPSYITGVLHDIINGTFINVTMIDSGNYTVPDPYVFNRLRMLIDFNITTPVELISLSATLLNNNVKLNWTTATETNNSGFEIEKKELGVGSQKLEWKTIGFVPGFGTTIEPKTYSFTDEHVSTGTYKYRLKQIDFDGSFEYSNEIEVVVDFTPKEFVLDQNYPNPFNPSTVISYRVPITSNVTLKVYDVLGNEVATLVNEEKQPGVYQVEFNTSHPGEVRNLKSGIYFYQLRAGSFAETKKMVILR